MGNKATQSSCVCFPWVAHGYLPTMVLHGLQADNLLPHGPLCGLPTKFSPTPSLLLRGSAVPRGEASGTGCAQHRAALASLHRGCPAAPLPHGTEPQDIPLAGH